MDLSDSPDQAAIARPCERGSPRIATPRRRPRAQQRGRRVHHGAPALAGRARRGRAGRGGMATGVGRPGPRTDRARHRQPGDLGRRRARDPRHDRRGHARTDAYRPRDRRAEGAPPRPDAPRGRGLVPAVLGARCRLGPCRHPGARPPAGRRLVAAQRPEGVDDERAVRVLRDAPRAHRRRRAEAQGPDDVHRADGCARRDRPRPPSDLGRGRVQRGLLRRRAPRCRRRRGPGRRRLADGADDAHVRAPHHRPGHGGPRLQGGPLRQGARRRRRRPPPTRRSGAASARSRPTSSR